jgi:hypothetical protein
MRLARSCRSPTNVMKGTQTRVLSKGAQGPSTLLAPTMLVSTSPLQQR